MISTDRLLKAFVSVADTLVQNYDVIAFLEELAEKAVAFTGADAAGILLADPDGHLHFAAASNQEARHLESLQAQREEGPCHDSFHTGRPVISLDLKKEVDRWPTFAPKAVRLGCESVHALPLRLREQRLGGLNLFGSEGAALDPEDLDVVQALADVATIGILQERSLHEAGLVTAQLQKALNSRVIIEQAKGAIAVYLDVTIDEAFQLLRSYTRHHRTSLTALCERILQDPAEMDALNEHRETRG